MRIEGVGGAVVSTTHSAVPGSAALPAPSDAVTVRSVRPLGEPGTSSGLTQSTATASSREHANEVAPAELKVKCAVVTLVGLAAAGEQPMGAVQVDRPR